MRHIALALASSCIVLSGCGTFFEGFRDSHTRQLPSTIGEVESGYTYIPIDPFPVETQPGPSCRGKERAPDATVLDSLPDNAVRMLVERFDRSGAISYGVSKSGLRDESYRVTVDYINADTINVAVEISKTMVKASAGDREEVHLFANDLSSFVPGSEQFEVSRVDGVNRPKSTRGSVFNIPVYVGVGLRVSSIVYVVGANANISGIGVIGAEAEAEKLKGSLVVQTLGVNGKSVAAALPIQSELNRTTAQNAIVAVGSIKALLYSPETITSPRVVGLYLPFPGGRSLVNALISELSKERLTWFRPCRGDVPTS